MFIGLFLQEYFSSAKSSPSVVISREDADWASWFYIHLSFSTYFKYWARLWSAGFVTGLKRRLRFFRSHGHWGLLESLWEEEIAASVSEPAKVESWKKKVDWLVFLPIRARHTRRRRVLSSDSGVVSAFDVSWQAPSPHRKSGLSNLNVSVRITMPFRSWNLVTFLFHHHGFLIFWYCT